MPHVHEKYSKTEKYDHSESPHLGGGERKTKEERKNTGGESTNQAK